MNLGFGFKRGVYFFSGVRSLRHIAAYMLTALLLFETIPTSRVFAGVYMNLAIYGTLLLRGFRDCQAQVISGMFIPSFLQLWWKQLDRHAL